MILQIVPVWCFKYILSLPQLYGFTKALQDHWIVKTTRLSEKHMIADFLCKRILGETGLELPIEVITSSEHWSEKEISLPWERLNTKSSHSISAY